MRKPNKPLFVIDDERKHGRGKETDWVCCTSASTPFVAMVTMENEAAFLEQYDKDDALTAWSLPQNGIRVRMTVTDIAEGYNRSEVRSLLRRGVKEYLLRRQVEVVDRDTVTDDNCVWLLDKLLEQNAENIRTDVETPWHKTIRAILLKMRKDYADG